MELGTGAPRNHPLIAFKDAKGIKDCRAGARAIFAYFVRSMCAGPIHGENSGKPWQPRESQGPRDSSRVALRGMPHSALFGAPSLAKTVFFPPLRTAILSPQLIISFFGAGPTAPVFCAV